MLELIAAGITFVFTTVLTIAGVGAAFILIPIFDAMGYGIREAMAVALLLNSVAMAFASVRFARKGLIEYRTAIPILIVATALSPAGAYTAQMVPEVPLRWMFIGFLLFAAVMMLFYRVKATEAHKPSIWSLVITGGWVGALAGFIGGLLGVGGGNIIVPVLVWLGFNPKRASGTTAFIVIFSSFSGFLGHATFGSINWLLLGAAAVGSAGGAVLGSYLMTDKMNRSQVKLVIGIVLLVIAAHMIWKLVR